MEDPLGSPVSASEHRVLEPTLVQLFSREKGLLTAVAEAPMSSMP